MCKLQIMTARSRQFNSSGQNSRVSGIYWPGCLDKFLGFRGSGRPCLKNQHVYLLKSTLHGPGWPPNISA